ncbi:MAG: histidinol-phosphate transaminase [Prevotellaceae bacterium]|nr:histidinol-phosphate transaminase [Prevotellaceae bacterium]MDD5992317.1 histidinol-phosphate transaminase [Prevotellaceae bacterium]MDD6008211.1 histidinol-phosphate transaminase [Prevotellaceae bacterium]MDD6111777.1 histidinol-phosphate transaminase [Prevotellaceae bacterium]
MKELKELTRENIWNLAPYSCARNEFSGRNAKVYLDANENPYNGPLNRYPDPLQLEVKKQLAKVKGVAEDCIFLGNGSDEAIDLMYRCFTEPKVDNVVAMDPTYGMYKVCADINDVEYRTVSLNEDFSLNADNILAACDNHTKVIWLCSPNNPTGNALDRGAIEKILKDFEGLVVVDEAYCDFSSQKPFRTELSKYPNIVVLNTMSKAWGSAGIRLGMAFASKDIIDILNKVKYPYNVNALTQREALELLADPYEVDKWVRTILLERSRVVDAIKVLPICRKVYPTDANFVLVEVDDARKTYEYLVDRGIIVRNRNSVHLCNGCLRITIGTKTENQELLAALRTM